MTKYFKEEVPSEKDAIDLFEHAIANRDADLVEEGLFLIYKFDLSLHFFIDVLCQLVKEDWHFKHEDIARLLKDIKSQQTVDCIYEATEMQFQYLEYDDTYQFARKCIKALAAIGGDNAVSKLRLLADSKTAEIAGYARKELRYMHLL